MVLLKEETFQRQSYTSASHYEYSDIKFVDDEQCEARGQPGDAQIRFRVILRSVQLNSFCYLGDNNLMGFIKLVL